MATKTKKKGVDVKKSNWNEVKRNDALSELTDHFRKQQESIDEMKALIKTKKEIRFELGDFDEFNLLDRVALIANALSQGLVIKVDEEYCITELESDDCIMEYIIEILNKIEGKGMGFEIISI